MAGKDGIRVHVYGDYDDKQINKAIKDLNRLKEQAQTSSEKFAAFGTSMATMGKKLSLGLTLPIVGAGIAAVKLASDFDSAMTKITSLVGISADEVKSMRDGVLGLSSETGKSADELADALFVVTSAGLRGDAAMKALESSAKAGSAGLGETADIARSVAGALNAYGPAALDAAKATDIVVATARAGNFETSQFAGALGRVLPFAKQAGASLEQVGGAVALLTRTNGDAAQSVTQVSALLKAFVVPTEEAKTALDAAGLSAKDMRDRISKDGLASALTFLDGKLGGNREQLGKLLGSSEAASAAFQILDADSQTLSDTFGVVTDSVGMTDDAFNTTSQTAGFKMQQAFNDLKVSMIGVGDVILPLVAGMAEKVSMLANAFTALPSPLKNVIVVFGGLLAAVGPVLFIAGKLMAAWVSATASISTAVLFLRTRFTTAMVAMQTSAQASMIKIKTSMIAAQTQIGALAMGARTAGTITLGAFRTIGVAAKGLLASLGPVGIGLIAVSAVYDILANGADRGAGSVDNLTEALKQQGDVGKKAAADMLAQDLYDANRFQLKELGYSYEEVIAAIVGGKDSAAAFAKEIENGPKGGGAVAKDLANSVLVLADNYATATAKVAEQTGVQADAYKAMGLTADGASTVGNALDGLGLDALGAAGDLGTLQTETQKLADLFLGFDKNVAAIRAKDEFRGFLRDIKDELEGNNRALFKNGQAAQDNRNTVLDALEKAKTDAVAWGNANNATMAQVEGRFQKNAETLKQTLVAEGFKKKDIEKFFGSEYVNVAGVTVQGQMATTLGTLAERLGPIALREFKGVGLDLGNGIALGVSASSPQIDVETRRAINNAERAARKAADSNSPSKLFAKVGEDLMLGLEKGIADKGKKVAEKAKAVIEEAYSTLKDSISAFDEYQTSVKGSIVGLLSLGDAYDAYVGRQQAVTNTLAELNKYQASIQGEATDDQKEKLSELQKAYHDASSDAANGAQSIVDEFVQQGKKLSKFTANMQLLLRSGLSRQAFDAIIAEGGERGANIADAMAQGNIQENIANVNAVYNSVSQMGLQVGNQAASTFLGQGVVLAESMLVGLIKEFMPAGKKRKELLSQIKSMVGEAVGMMSAITSVSANSALASYNPATAAIPSSTQSLPVTSAQQQVFNDFAAVTDWSSIFPTGLPAFATGGIVTKPTVGLIGEAGPEAIIPLSKAGSVGTTGATINVTINAGMGANGQQLGQQIVEEIKRFERSNGPQFVSA
jgi:TP901 family phage tail tape measure protein